MLNSSTFCQISRQRLRSLAACSLMALFFNPMASNASLLTENLQCRLKLNLQDSGARGLSFNSASPLMLGQCLNEDKFRAIKILRKKPNSLTINNYKHRGQFWHAEIPVNLVKKVEFQIVYFDVLPTIAAAHTQIKFYFSEPIHLVSQSNQARRTSTDNLMISVEAGFPKGQQYNFAAGVLPYYALVHRFLSKEERESEATQNLTGLLGYKIFGEFVKERSEDYTLNLTGQEAKQLLLSLIERGNSLKLDYHYGTMRPNCTTELFDHIDLLPSVRSKGLKPFETQVSNDPIGGPSLAALRARGLIE